LGIPDFPALRVEGRWLVKLEHILPDLRRVDVVLRSRDSSHVVVIENKIHCADRAGHQRLPAVAGQHRRPPKAPHLSHTRRAPAALRFEHVLLRIVSNAHLAVVARPTGWHTHHVLSRSLTRRAMG
jgi:hypothetical protein